MLHNRNKFYTYKLLLYDYDVSRLTFVTNVKLATVTRKTLGMWPSKQPATGKKK